MACSVYDLIEAEATVEEDLPYEELGETVANVLFPTKQAQSIKGDELVGIVAANVMAKLETTNLGRVLAGFLKNKEASQALTRFISGLHGGSNGN